MPGYRPRYANELPRRALFLTISAMCLLAAALAGSSCGRSRPPILIGSQNETEQMVVGEIVAQHLEKQLQRKVERRLGLGGELILYQAITGGVVTLYPDYVGSIESVILKEDPNPDPAVALERARSEIRRVAQLELVGPLGYENPPAVVVRSADAAEAKARTLSEAAAGAFRWKLGLSYEFQQRSDVLPAVNSYKLPMAQGPRGMDAAKLFPALRNGDVTMIVTSTANGNLASPDYQILTDDKKAFPPYQACLLVRLDALAQEPQMQTALAQLSGKFTIEGVRKLSAEVDLQHRQLAAVAAEFLAAAGLK